MPRIFDLPFAAHLWGPILILIFVQSLAVYTWQFRKEPGARWMSLSMMCGTGWMMSLILARTSPGTDAKVAWITIFAFLTYLPGFFWYQAIAQLSGFDRKAPRWTPYLFAGIAGACSLVILSNCWTGWYWKSIWIQGGAQVCQIPGVLYVPCLLAAYSLYLTAIVIHAHWIWKSAGLRRRQAIMFLWPILLVLTGSVLNLIPGATHTFAHPMTLLLSSLLVAWAYHRWRSFGILPKAQDVALASMIDGLLVIDEQDYIVQMNAAAQELFAGLPVREAGKFAEASKGWTELAGFLMQSAVNTAEINRMTESGSKTYLAAKTPLRADSGLPLGHVLILKDITRDKQQSERILEQQKAISILTERQRIGRELHDGPGQLLSFVSLQAEDALALLDQQETDLAIQRLNRLVQVAQDTHLDLRESITGLQTTITPARGFLDALQEQLRWYREHCNFETTLDLQCAWQEAWLAPPKAAQAFRILQEALANVRKSAQASQVRVMVRREGEKLLFLVEDNGSGFDPMQVSQQTGHHGLKIMQERAREMGAHLEIDSQPDAGTRIRLRFALSA
jgi:signal transduction histidine kinase